MILALSSETDLSSSTKPIFLAILMMSFFLPVSNNNRYCLADNGELLSIRYTYPSTIFISIGGNTLLRVHVLKAVQIIFLEKFLAYALGTPIFERSAERALFIFRFGLHGSIPICYS